MHWEDYSRLRGRRACWLSNSDRIETHESESGVWICRCFDRRRL
jgi:hypothetical protein